MADLTEQIAHVAPYANTDSEGNYTGDISEEQE